MGFPLPRFPAGHNAFITNNGTYTVTVPQNTLSTVSNLTVGGASGTQTLAIDKTTLTLNGPSVINANGHLISSSPEARSPARVISR